MIKLEKPYYKYNCLIRIENNNISDDLLEHFHKNHFYVDVPYNDVKDFNGVVTHKANILITRVEPISVNVFRNYGYKDVLAVALVIREDVLPHNWQKVYVDCGEDIEKFKEMSICVNTDN